VWEGRHFCGGLRDRELTARGRGKE